MVQLQPLCCKIRTPDDVETFRGGYGHGDAGWAIYPKDTEHLLVEGWSRSTSEGVYVTP